MSAECVKSELDLFTLPYTQTSIDKNVYMEIPPLSAITDTGPLEFYIAGNGEDYLDLNNTLLLLTCKIVKQDGTNLDPGAPVGVINYPIATIFSQVDVCLGDRLISQASNTYPYRALLECLLNYGKETLATQFSAGLFFKDTAAHMDVHAPAGHNAGLTSRAAFSAESHQFELIGHVHADIFFQEKLLLNGVDVKVKFSRSKDEFCLMGVAADNNKLKIISASLYVKKVTVSPPVKIGHAQALLSATAKYPIERVCIKTFSLPAGGRVCTQENLFLGPLPKCVVIGMVDNDAYTGSYVKNPFNFKHYDAEFISMYVNGVQYPSKPFLPNFRDDNAVREFYSLIQATGKQMKDQAMVIDRTEYLHGYTLYGFNMTPDEDCGQHLSLVNSGNMRLELRFRNPLPNTVNVIVYATFDNIVEINQRRNVLIDYY